MADGVFLSAGAETAVQDALMAALRADPVVQSVFGDPARVHDDETRGAAFPYARLERHETRPADASGCAGAEHVVTLSTLSRHGGRREAVDAVSALREAVNRADLQPVGQRVVLVQPTYSDVFRTTDRRAFRGVLRIRIISEGAV
ncbi:MAG: DUF3168 domain-containing protein [Pseudomonadota bacterium]